MEGGRWQHIVGAPEGKASESMRETSFLHAHAACSPLNLLGDLREEVACVCPASLWLHLEEGCAGARLGQGAHGAASALVQAREGEGQRERRTIVEGNDHVATHQWSGLSPALMCSVSVLRNSVEQCGQLRLPPAEMEAAGFVCKHRGRGSQCTRQGHLP